MMPKDDEYIDALETINREILKRQKQLVEESQLKMQAEALNTKHQHISIQENQPSDVEEKSNSAIFRTFSPMNGIYGGSSNSPKVALHNIIEEIVKEQ
jgi:hypothetical protein